MNYNVDEAPRYRKKKTKKTPKKANHKHEWEPVILDYWNKNIQFLPEKGFVGGDDSCRGRRCIICGKLAFGFPEGFEEKPTPSTWWSYRNKHLTMDYPNLPRVRVKDIWANDIKEEKKDE